MVLKYIKQAADYYNEYKDLIDVAGSAGKAYLDYKDQKRKNVAAFERHTLSLLMHGV